MSLSWKRGKIVRRPRRNEGTVPPPAPAAAGGGAGAGRSAVAARLSWREDVQPAPVNPTNRSDARIDT